MMTNRQTKLKRSLIGTAEKSQSRCTNLSMILLFAFVILTMAPCSIGQASLTILHETADNVLLWKGLSEPQIQSILDGQIGFPRTTITFDHIWRAYVGPGSFDDRLIGQGIRLEGISGWTLVGGTSNSGPINGGGLTVCPNWNFSRVRIHFVIPGTTTPTTVDRVGAFTTTPDKDYICMEFFDSSENSLGIGYVQSPNPYPRESIEFLGADSSGGEGIAFVDVFSGGSTAYPYELDLLTFTIADFPPQADAGPDQTVIEGETVQFNGSGSFDPFGTITSYEWDFGDGTPIESGVMVSHAYDTARTYIVTLTVTDNDGNTGTDTATVTVLTPAEVIEELIDIVEKLGLLQGIENSLLAKLNNALKKLEDVSPNNDVAAIHDLDAFINEVEAQEGKMLTYPQANELIFYADWIISALIGT